MKKINRYSYIVVVLMISGLILIPTRTEAQWSVGASFETRTEDPTNGFGVRVERSILNIIPIVDIGLRAHFSFFSENSTFQNVDTEFQSYDFGLAATGGVSLGLFTPYVGVGIGSDNFQIERGDSKLVDESNFYWNAFGGAKLTIIPLLSPFVEYRWTQLSGVDEIGFDNFGRLAVGVSLNF
ncbi:MAG: outer membrane protein [Balneolaceae bacterium]